MSSFEILAHQEFESPLVVSLFKVGKTVLFCVFSTFIHRVPQFVIDKLIFSISVEINDALKLTFVNKLLTVLKIPDRF